MQQVTKKRFYNKSMIIWIIAVGLVFPLYYVIKVFAVTGDVNAIGNIIRGHLPDFLCSLLISFILFTSNTLIYGYSCKAFPHPSQQLNRLFLFIIISLITSNLLAIGVVLIVYPGGNSRESIFQLVTFITIITLIVSLVMLLLNAFEMWKRSIVEKELIEKENVRSQLESLRTQINPHFLFNSLNALQSLIETDPQKSKEFIQQLAKVYRYVLEHKNELVVELKEEMEFIESYIYLNKIRFGVNLEFSANLQSADMDKFIPPLTLQILIENAIKHNIISNDKPLHIEINSTDYNAIQVINNLQLRTEKPESTGIGLHNLTERYRLIHEILPTFIIINGKYVATIPFVIDEKVIT